MTPPEDHPYGPLESLLESRYAVLEVLGEGGGGIVYRVQNIALAREEALKVLAGNMFRDNLERFALEARTAASLDHPHIVKIHDFGHSQDAFWCSMQLVDGPTVHSLMKERGALDTATALRIALPILEALAYSHARGVIHRDIKPANILLSAEGQPFLTDFGIAKVHGSTLKTQTGQTLGTPAYMAPEQAAGDPVDARTDLYGLGLTIFEMLTGGLPFSNQGSLMTLVARLKEDPEPILHRRPDLDPGVASVIMKVLARDPDDRWKDAAEMREALAAAADEARILWRRPVENIPARERHPEARDLSVGLVSFVAGPKERATVAIPGKRPAEPGGWKLPVAAASVVGLAVAGYLIFRKPAAQATTPPPVQAAAPAANTAPPPAAPVASAPGAAAPKAAPAPAAAPLPRRAVQAPQPEDTPPAGVGAAPGCAGATVNLSVVVGEDGRVKTCRVLSSARPDCAKAAQDAVLRWKFKPALDAQGQPVEATVAVAVPFQEAP